MGKKRNVSGKSAKAKRAAARRQKFPAELVKAVGEKLKKESQQAQLRKEASAKKSGEKKGGEKQKPAKKPPTKRQRVAYNEEEDSDNTDEEEVAQQQLEEENDDDDDDDDDDSEDDSDDDMSIGSDEGLAEEGEGLLLGDLPPGLYLGKDVPHIRVPGNMPRGHKPRAKAEKKKRTYDEACDEDELPTTELVFATASDDEEEDEEVEEKMMEEDDEEDDDDEQASDESDEEMLHMTSQDAATGEEQEKIDITFEFFDPCQGDFHNIKMLVQRYLDDRAFDSSGLADHVCGQTRVGTCVKGDTRTDDSLFGFVSVVNLRHHKDKEFVKQVKKCILAECPDEATKGALKEMLTSPKERVGLLVSEKYANFPVELLAPLNRAISDEILWAREDEPTEALKKSYQFTKLIKLTSAFDNETPGVQAGKKKKKRPAVPEPIWKFFDDEVLAKHAVLKYGFKKCVPTTEAAQATSGGMDQRRHVVVLNANSLPAVAKELETILS